MNVQIGKPAPIATDIIIDSIVMRNGSVQRREKSNSKNPVAVIATLLAIAPTPKPTIELRSESPTVSLNSMLSIFALAAPLEISIFDSNRLSLILCLIARNVTIQARTTTPVALRICVNRIMICHDMKPIMELER